MISDYDTIRLLVMETNNTNKDFINSLSTRSKFGLARCFGSIPNDPAIIAEAGIKKLEMTVQLGPKSFREIAELLYKFGYIDDPDQWLGGYGIH